MCIENFRMNRFEIGGCKDKQPEGYIELPADFARFIIFEDAGFIKFYQVRTLVIRLVLLTWSLCALCFMYFKPDVFIFFLHAYTLSDEFKSALR